LLCRSRASSSPVPWSQSRPIPSPRPLQSKPIKIKPSSCISYIKIKLYRYVLGWVQMIWFF
jgi:hypothetical protein